MKIAIVSLLVLVLSSTFAAAECSNKHKIKEYWQFKVLNHIEENRIYAHELTAIEMALYLNLLEELLRKYCVSSGK